MPRSAGTTDPAPDPRPDPRARRGPRRPEALGGDIAARRAARQKALKAQQAGVYRRRRFLAVGLVLLGAVALVFAVFAQSTGAAEGAVPIDPANAEPDTVLAQAGNGVQVSTPIRPSDLTGLGYHPDGESLLEMEPRGKNLSAIPPLRLFGGSTPEDIRYYVMPREGREGAATGALDVGAGAGSTVYAPVTGTVTAIRPDPMMADANVVEIKPDSNPNVRVYVSLVQSEKGSAGVKEPVIAGMTELGTVAESASVLDPQLSDYTSDAGNHVTVSASRL